MPKQTIFKNFLFQDNVVKNSCPIAWWQSCVNTNPAYANSKVMVLITNLMTSVCSSSCVECVFLIIGLAHSKLRNRMGVEKTGTLVFVNRMSIPCNDFIFIYRRPITFSGYVTLLMPTWTLTISIYFCIKAGLCYIITSLVLKQKTVWNKKTVSLFFFYKSVFSQPCY